MIGAEKFDNWMKERQNNYNKTHNQAFIDFLTNITGKGFTFIKNYTQFCSEAKLARLTYGYNISSPPCSSEEFGRIVLNAFPASFIELGKEVKMIAPKLPKDVKFDLLAEKFDKWMQEQKKVNLSESVITEIERLEKHSLTQQNDDSKPSATHIEELKELLAAQQDNNSKFSATHIGELREFFSTQYGVLENIQTPAEFFALSNCIQEKYGYNCNIAPNSREEFLFYRMVYTSERCVFTERPIQIPEEFLTIFQAADQATQEWVNPAKTKSNVFNEISSPRGTDELRISPHKTTQPSTSNDNIPNSFMLK